MTALESLRQQLSMYTQLQQECNRTNRAPLRFFGSHDLVLQHGTVFPLATGKPPVVPIPKACFQQAYRLATRKDSKWIYCEGYAVPRIGLATHHAWVTRADNPTEAYDLAWSDELTSVDCSGAYLGIPLQADYVRRVHVGSNRCYFGVLDAWWANHPLLTGEVRIEDVMWRPGA